MMDDPVDEIAWAVAARLTPEFGPRTESEVAAALYARLQPGNVNQYDLVAIGSLIVSIAALAWQVYTDHRNKEPNSSRKVSKRVLRTEILREFEETPTTLRVTEVVIDRILSTPGPADHIHE
jgi:hypothetical protein